MSSYTGIVRAMALAGLVAAGISQAQADIIAADPGTISGLTLSGVTVSPSMLTGATTSTGTISGGTVSASTLTGATVSAPNLTATTITAGTISAGTVTGTILSGGTVTAATLTATTISSGTISGGTISNATLAGGTLTGTTLTGTTNIVGGTVTMASITAATLNLGGGTLSTQGAVTVTGNLAQTGGVLGISLGAPGQSSVLNVQGSASFASASQLSFNFANSAELHAGESFAWMNVGGIVSGMENLAVRTSGLLYGQTLALSNNAGIYSATILGSVLTGATLAAPIMPTAPATNTGTITGGTVSGSTITGATISGPTPTLAPATATFSNVQIFDPNSVIYFDPAVAVGYDYFVDSGPKFASVLLPNVGDGQYQLWLDDGAGGWTLADTLTQGVAYDFASGGVSSFRILGIETSAGLDPTSPTAFVTGLTFTGAGTVDIRQVAISQDIPEPGTPAILLLGLAALGLARRKTWLPGA